MGSGSAEDSSDEPAQDRFDAPGRGFHPSPLRHFIADLVASSNMRVAACSRAVERLTRASAAARRAAERRNAVEALHRPQPARAAGPALLKNDRELRRASIRLRASSRGGRAQALAQHAPCDRTGSRATSRPEAARPTPVLPSSPPSAAATPPSPFTGDESGRRTARSSMAVDDC